MPYADKVKQREYIARRRQRQKRRAVEYKGGSCQDCGYKECIAALVFHHPNDDKEFSLGSHILNRSWDRVVVELDKCVLLCANCHSHRHHPC
jgi:hypothetical protein